MMEAVIAPMLRERESVTLTGDASGERLDMFLSKALGLTRSLAQRLLKEGRVLLDARSGDSQDKLRPENLKPSSRVQEGSTYRVVLPEFENMEIDPEPVDFRVIYEDQDILVIDKPAGLVVHPAPGHWRGTLVHGLLWRYPEMARLGNRLRPGIVHRLDATTSGLMLVARSQSAMEELQRMFSQRQVTKEYLALLHGSTARHEGTLSGPIARDPRNPLRMAVVADGRPALTGYRVLWNKGAISLVVCRLFTGRTHQIRVHMAAMGHPLVGDALYGAPREDGFERVFLHSWKLGFTHPVTGAEMAFRLPLPRELIAYLTRSSRSAP